MLRMAFRLGATLDTAFTEVNNLLVDVLPPDRFITAFIGLLDAAGHRLVFHSGGQGPILVFRAATGECEVHAPTSFPVAAMPIKTQKRATTVEFAPGDILVLLSDGYLEYGDPDGEEFGKERVQQVLREHHGKTMAEVARVLSDSVHAFARGMPQEDDMTAVLIQRQVARAPATASFKRSIDSLEAIFGFIGEMFASQEIDDSLRTPIDFAIEELFTNMVKYGKTRESRVRITLSRIPDGVEATLIDPDAEPFDVTKVPDAEVDLPIEQRVPGGLGLHLVRRMVDSLEYEYREDLRQTRITIRKTSGGGHVHD